MLLVFFDGLINKFEEFSFQKKLRWNYINSPL